ARGRARAPPRGRSRSGRRARAASSGRPARGRRARAARSGRTGCRLRCRRARPRGGRRNAGSRGREARAARAGGEAWGRISEEEGGAPLGEEAVHGLAVGILEGVPRKEYRGFEVEREVLEEAPLK